MVELHDERSNPTRCLRSYSESNACRIDPLDFAKEGVGLLDLVDRLTLGQPILQPPAQGGGGYGGRQPGGAAPGEAPRPPSRSLSFTSIVAIWCGNTM